jgi:DNA-binding MarR family transcriptional regulator
MELDRLILRQVAGPGSWNAMQALLARDEPLTQAELGEAIKRSQPAVSRALAALARADLVTWHRDQDSESDRSRGRPPVRWGPDREQWDRLTKH